MGLNKDWRLSVSTFLIMFAVLIPFGVIRDNSPVPLDSYKRYQGKLWVDEIINTGYISESPFQADHLFQRANELIHSPANSVLISMTSMITDIYSNTIIYSPIYTFTFLLILSVLCYRIIGSQFALMVAMVVGVSFQFSSLEMMSSAHRGFLAWTMYFLILYSIILASGKRRIILVMVSGFSLTISDHTLPISGLIFIVSIFILEQLPKLTNNYIYADSDWDISYTTVALLAIAPLAYFTIIYTWIPETFGVLLVGLSDSIGDFASAFNLFPGAVYGEELSPYVLEFTRDRYHIIYLVFSIISRVVSASAIIITFLIRAKEFAKSRTLKNIDFILVGVVVQSITNIFLSQYFAASGGISARTLVIFTTPIFIPYLLYRYWGSKIGPPSTIINLKTGLNGHTLLVVLVSLIIIVPAITVTIWPSPRLSEGSIDSSSNTQASWVVEYSSGQITSDFRMLSTIIYHGGKAIYLPSTDLYTSDKVVNRLTESYYTNPSVVFEHSKYYVISDLMMDYGIYHMGALKTIPNPSIDDNLREDQRTGKIHTTGNDIIYTRLYKTHNVGVS